MSQRMKTQAAFLLFLFESRKRQQKAILQTITPAQTDVIAEICLNIYQGILPGQRSYIKELQPYKSVIRLLSSREIGLVQKKNLLLKHLKLITLILKPVVKLIKVQWHKN